MSRRGSGYPVSNRIARFFWGATAFLLVRFSPRPLHAWRAAVYRAWGAKLGRGCHIYPGAKVWAPWLLECGDGVCLADGAEVYNPAGAALGDGAVISQGAFLCGATHDFDDPDFPLVESRIEIGARAWVAARAIILPGAKVGEGSVIGAGSVVTRATAPWSVNAGNPCRAIGERNHERRG